MSDSSMMDTFVSGLGALAVIYFLLWGLLYLIYGKALVVRLWHRLGPGIMIFAFLGVLAGKIGHMGVSDLITKGLIPLGGLALMTTNLIIVAHGIARPIQRAVKGITEGADEVADASGQIPSASNTLSSGATEQAAAIEETSASLEEMSAMVFDARREGGRMTETDVISRHKGQQQT